MTEQEQNFVVLRVPLEMQKLMALNDFVRVAGLNNGDQSPSDEQIIDAVKKTLKYAKGPAEGPSR